MWVVICWMAPFMLANHDTCLLNRRDHNMELGKHWVGGSIASFFIIPYTWENVMHTSIFWCVCPKVAMISNRGIMICDGIMRYHGCVFVPEPKSVPDFGRFRPIESGKWGRQPTYLYIFDIYIYIYVIIYVLRIYKYIYLHIYIYVKGN